MCKNQSFRDLPRLTLLPVNLQGSSPQIQNECPMGFGFQGAAPSHWHTPHPSSGSSVLFEQGVICMTLKFLLDKTE